MHPTLLIVFGLVLAAISLVTARWRRMRNSRAGGDGGKERRKARTRATLRCWEEAAEQLGSRLERG